MLCIEIPPYMLETMQVIFKLAIVKNVFRIIM